MKKFFKDFKDFAVKGNIIDMAVGIIIGGAFAKIVSAFVENIVTPLISLLMGNVTFDNWVIHIREAVMDGEEVVKAAVDLNIGAFLQAIIDFILIALCIFIVLRLIMNAKKKAEDLKKKEEEEASEEEAPADTELSVLLEIRDMLAKDKE